MGDAPHDEINFGRNLRDARKAARLTQRELAENAGIDRATISLIENGRENPRADTVLKLAEVLGVNPADLWRRESRNYPDPHPPDPEDREELEKSLAMVRESGDLRYEPLNEYLLHPGLEELLGDERTRLMLSITEEEEAMLRSIRTRRDAPLNREFFLDVLISYRRHHLRSGEEA